MNSIYKFSKSSTLNFLKKKNFDNNLIILPQFGFTKKYYEKKKEVIIKKIIEKFKKKKIIIRSSAVHEDSIKNSFAGKYKSFLNIDSDSKKIPHYISEILKDFENPNDKIFIQEFLDKPKISGVIFTFDPNTSSNYYVINYDYSKKTNLITSGIENPSMKLMYIFKNSKILPKKFKLLIHIVKKIEKFFFNNAPKPLDIEFAIKNQKIYIFQCRSLNIKIKSNLINTTAIDLISKKIIKIKNQHPFLHGKTTLLSNMADWNPAEIIGSTSKIFSTSVYKHLITNDIWSEQRSDYGYKDVRPNPLMVTFGSHNYVDLRTDLNSFLPKRLNAKISEKVVNFFINKINKKPHLHDKIEFEIVPTCYQSNLKSYLKKTLSKREIDTYIMQLIEITEKLIRKNNSPLYKEISSLKTLEKEADNIKNSKLSEIPKIFFLTSICKKYGTLPFSGIARLAFITKKILNNLVEDKIISQSTKENFLISVNTLIKIINVDFLKLKSKIISKKKFLERYGHLRPSTYSISIPSYKENFNTYFDLKNNNKYRNEKIKFSFSHEEIKNINEWFNKNNLNIKCNDLVSCAKKSIFYREYSKLKFTKVLDLIFQEVIKFCKRFNIQRDDIEYLDFNILINAYNFLDIEELSSIIKKNIQINKKLYNRSKKIILPDLIINRKDCYFYDKRNTYGNYITNKNIVGEIKIVDNKDKNLIKKIKNKIILIENADPGYDFIFNHNIKGLITMYGGPNSHMSIRCHELQIPAIIGIGSDNFNKIKLCNKLSINCSKRKFELIN